MADAKPQTTSAAADGQGRRSRLASRLVRSFGLIALFLAAALFGTASGVLFAFVGDLPRNLGARRLLARARSPACSARDGSVVGEFATERRAGRHLRSDSRGPPPRDHRRRRRRVLQPRRPAHRPHPRSRSAQDVISPADVGAPARSRSSSRASSSSPTIRRRSARSRKRCSRSRSRSGTRSRKSSRCTATRCTGATASTASRRRRSCTSPSRRRT